MHIRLMSLQAAHENLPVTYTWLVSSLFLALCLISDTAALHDLFYKSLFEYGRTWITLIETWPIFCGHREVNVFMKQLYIIHSNEVNPALSLSLRFVPIP